MFHATKVIPSEFQPESNSNWRNRKRTKPANEAGGKAVTQTQQTEEDDEEIEEVLEVDEDESMAD